MTDVGGVIKARGAPFREGTELHRTKYAFVFNSGGIGDYIHWTTPIQWAIESSPHLYGYIYAPKFFKELADLWFAPYSDRFEVITGDSVNDPRVLASNRAVPDGKQLSNQCSHHMFNVGWTYFCQMGFIPDGWNRLPRIKGDEADISRFIIPENYAVIPTHATAENRRLSPKAIEEISAYLVRHGVTPVYIGKSVELTDYRATTTAADLSQGIDLRDRTTLVESACIMARARFVLGIDGGMLHLACCSDVPVLMGFTSVHPKVRVPPRRLGAKTAVIAPPEGLACRFCNTNMKFIIGHDFKNCLYGDNYCATTLGLEAFVPAINRILEEK